MKSLWVTSLFSLGILSSCSSQDIPASKVPSVVLNSVVEKYPVTNEVDWKKKNKQYEAEVKLNDSTDVTFLVNDAGKIVRQKEDVERTVIPSGILDVLKTSYVDYIIDDVEKIAVGNKFYYQFELEGKGKKDLNLVFTPDGTLTKEIKFWD